MRERCRTGPAAATSQGLPGFMISLQRRISRGHRATRNGCPGWALTVAAESGVGAHRPRRLGRLGLLPEKGLSATPSAQAAPAAVLEMIRRDHRRSWRRWGARVRSRRAGSTPWPRPRTRHRWSEPPPCRRRSRRVSASAGRASVTRPVDLYRQNRRSAGRWAPSAMINPDQPANTQARSHEAIREPGDGRTRSGSGCSTSRAGPWPQQATTTAHRPGRW